MKTERTRSGAKAVTLSEVAEHLRLTWTQDEAVTLHAMIAAATLEIEERAGLAILDQTVVATTGPAPGVDIELSVGPVTAGATATVAMLGDDGTTTPVASGFWLEAGRWPVLHVTDPAITGRLVITYTAGMGTAPQDVRHAIADQVGLMYEARGEAAKAPPLTGFAAQLIARRGRVRL